MFPLTFLVLQDVGGKTSLVSYIGGVLAIFLLDDILQVVVDLSTDTHGLLEAACSDRKDHELLHGQLVACVGAAVDDVESLTRSKQGRDSVQYFLGNGHYRHMSDRQCESHDMCNYHSHRDGEDDFRVASQVGDVAVEGNAFLSCTSLAHSQGDAQDGISTKLS